MICSAAAAAQATDADARKYFTDTEVVDQNGKKLRLYSDLMDGKTVIVLPFYSTDTAVAPVLIRTLASLQNTYRDRSGEFNIIAVSVDPVVDTPSRNKALATKYNLGPNFYFITGEKNNVDLVAKKFGIYVENKTGSTSIILIGNNKTGLWKKAFGLGKPEDLEAVFRSVIDDKKK